MGKITNMELVTPHTMILSIKRPEDFVFEAGQFVQFLIPDGEKETPRSYSLASDPQNENLIFAIKLVDKGFASTYLKNLKVGKEIKVRGPLGHFFCKEDDKSMFMVATGTGIAPVMGIIEDQLKNKANKNKIHLLWGLRFAEDIFWKEKLEELTQKYTNFTYMLTVSQPNESWNGMQGRVTMYINHPSTSYVYYLCGNHPMIMDVRKILEEAKVPAEQVKFEVF
jgi:ferredoxin-NADP reductase